MSRDQRMDGTKKTVRQRRSPLSASQLGGRTSSCGATGQRSAGQRSARNQPSAR